MASCAGGKCHGEGGPARGTERADGRTGGDLLGARETSSGRRCAVGAHVKVIRDSNARRFVGEFSITKCCECSSVLLRGTGLAPA